MFERRRLDGRLASLRGFSTDALDRAGVGIGRAAGYGFAGPRATLEELRLLLPVRDAERRTVGLLAIAPNPTSRAEPKVLARPGTPRLPLELVEVEEPLTLVVLAVTEGEPDCLTAASAGIPAVGVPGLGGFAAHAARIAELVREHGFERAILIPDGDAAGRASFQELAASIDAAGAPAVLADVLEDGADVGSALVALAAELELERPEISPTERRHVAGAVLLSLTEGGTRNV
jgi:hypothetical protein